MGRNKLDNKKTITISEEEYAKLKLDQKFLEALKYAFRDEIEKMVQYTKAKSIVDGWMGN